MKSTPDVLVSMPCYDSYKRDMMRCTSDLMQFSARRDIFCLPHWSGGSNIAINRVDAVYRARECGAKWLLFIDSDMVFVPESLITLIEKKKDIISGLYFGKAGECNPIAANKNENGTYTPLNVITPGELTKVDAVGGGFLLINVAVFDYITEPYFAFEPIEGNKYPFGEDWYFCRKAQKAGYDIWLDCSVLCGHLGDMVYSLQHFMVKKKIRMEKAEAELKELKGGLILPAGA